VNIENILHSAFRILQNAKSDYASFGTRA